MNYDIVTTNLNITIPDSADEQHYLMLSIANEFLEVVNQENFKNELDTLSHILCKIYPVNRDPVYSCIHYIVHKTKGSDIPNFYIECIKKIKEIDPVICESFREDIKNIANGTIQIRKYQ